MIRHTKFRDIVYKLSIRIGYIQLKDALYQRRINQGVRGARASGPPLKYETKNHPKYRGNFSLLEIIFI